MHGIVALLDEEHTHKVEALWGELTDACGLSCIQLTPFPHFSWHIAEGYNFEPLEDQLEKIAKSTPPFTIHTAGLGVFTGESPVVYVQVVKAPYLLKLHEFLWKETAEFGSEISQHYSPSNWMPHITLANRDVTSDNLPCIFSLLGSRNFAWEIPIKEFAIGHQNDDQAGKITRKFALKAS